MRHHPVMVLEGKIPRGYAVGLGHNGIELAHDEYRRWRLRMQQPHMKGKYLGLDGLTRNPRLGVTALK
jgi:hypothetical protein